MKMDMDDDDFTAEQHDKDNDQEKDPRQEYERWQGLESDALDLELDKALAQYSAVEPRTGLEDRVLANLRAEQTLAPARVWWRWTAVAALAALLLVALTFLWRSGERRNYRDNVARDPFPAPARTTPDRSSNGTQMATHRGGDENRATHPVSARKPRTNIPRAAPALVASGPKLDQFPSPQPLSEQEKILASYVTKYPKNAALIARARAEALRQDLAEEMKDAAATKDSQQ
jgi:hypothetical protein